MDYWFFVYSSGVIAAMGALSLESTNRTIAREDFRRDYLLKDWPKERRGSAWVNNVSKRHITTKIDNLGIVLKLL